MTTASSPRAMAAPLGVATDRPVVVGWLLLTVVAFWSTWVELPQIWNEDRTHGYVAAALSLWLVWRERARLMAGGEPSTLALPIAALSSLLWLAGTIVSAQLVQIAMLPVVLVAWLVAIQGREALKPALPIAAVFSLAVPIWEVLVWPLQMLTVMFNAVALKIVGIEAVIRGESITLPSGTLVVAGSCSGINYLMTAVTIAAVYAMLFLQRGATRWRVVGVAAFMALLANWIRVFGLVVVADRSNMQSSLVRDHGTYGWVIFAIAMVIFFVVASRLERADRAYDVPVNDAADDAQRRSVMHRQGETGPKRAVVLATLAAVVGPVLFWSVSGLPTAPSPDNVVPGAVLTAGFRPLASTPHEWTPSFAGATETRVAHLQRSDVDIQVNRLVFRNQTRGAELVGGGNRIAPDSVLLSDRIIGPLDATLRMVGQAAVREQGKVRLVWYWYQVANRSTPFPARARVMELLAFVRRSPSSELVTLSALCEQQECQRVANVLQGAVTGQTPSSGTGTP